MAEINESLHCCGLLEIGDFDYSGGTKKAILDAILNYYENAYTDEFPWAFYATTHSDQKQTEQALKELKFKATKFKSRHDTNGRIKALTHWFRASPPKEIMKQVRKLQKEMKSDNW